jgi:hypothetical protein
MSGNFEINWQFWLKYRLRKHGNQFANILRNYSFILSRKNQHKNYYLKASWLSVKTMTITEKTNMKHDNYFAIFWGNADLNWMKLSTNVWGISFINVKINAITHNKLDNHFILDDSYFAHKWTTWWHANFVTEIHLPRYHGTFFQNNCQSMSQVCGVFTKFVVPVIWTDKCHNWLNHMILVTE